MATKDDLRARVLTALHEQRSALIELCQALVCQDSQNPPGDTSAIATVCFDALAHVPGITAERVVRRAPMVNVVARVRGAAPGRRLVLNGHLDTAQLASTEGWTVPPFGGVVRDGRLYGRGATDMKAGIAAEIMAARVLSQFAGEWRGELVLTLAADEGTGAENGTLHLLRSVPHASGDAMLSGDVGSPEVVRFGEKGFAWVEIVAHGKAAGGAHMYLGVNANILLMEALPKLTAISRHACDLPPAIMEAILQASDRSEAIAGAGETAALRSITVNVGRIGGGNRPNAVPAEAHALLDIRFPPGMTVQGVFTLVQEALRECPRVSAKLLDHADPNWTEPGHELAGLVRRNAARLLGHTPVATIRAGFSDARFYREHGIASIGYGVTAHNGAAPDEYVDLDDLWTICAVHTLTALDYLTA
jgi:acetylornithine deacetylase/succinyl-diaminopimelate desuccinylase-like protein